MNRRRTLGAITVLAGLLAVLTFAACDPSTVTQPIPAPPPTATPCGVGCAPQFNSPAGAKLVATDHFTFWYYDPPWTLAAHDTATAMLTRTSPYGAITVKLQCSQVTSGTQAADLLSGWVKSNLDPTKYQGLRDAGPIHGAEVGYVAGAGEAYSAHLALPNAPAAPVYLEVEAATHDTAGIVVVVLSPLNPSTPNAGDSSQVHRGAYDRLVNSLKWR